MTYKKTELDLVREIAVDALEKELGFSLHDSVIMEGQNRMIISRITRDVVTEFLDEY